MSFMVCPPGMGGAKVGIGRMCPDPDCAVLMDAVPSFLWVDHQKCDGILFDKGMVEVDAANITWLKEATESEEPCQLCCEIRDAHSGVVTQGADVLQCRGEIQLNW